MPETNEITVSTTIYDLASSISVDGDVRMTVSQIKIRPAQGELYCGVSLNYPRTSKYDWSNGYTAMGRTT